ncbi:TetR/AcrR family transcriptional regulator [Lactobacillus sp. ESL0791]|uniref:TetR/AcrR family transcriptional regulator n=1 Tax=Lactobacillus sp. ESL0791 TaxID=2983234 RepID=UPI0023F8E492|nr:TetR/AcrR family transcriptional regulator [Lactobacillus sp. ESL0791]MDF7639344.1 TetR/AcrR family transcriptional regulator [Lactobacillus sp. ESL0791]
MENTETELITKTINVIDKQGYQNLSLRKLTSSLGLTTGAFYKHFASKEDLYQKVTSQLSQEFIAQVNLTAPKPANQILQIADYFVQQVELHPNIMNFLFFNEAAVAALNSEVSAYPFLAKIRALIADLDVKSGTSKQDFFIQIWSFIQGYAFLIQNGVTHYDKTLVKTTLQELLGGEK